MAQVEKINGEKLRRDRDAQGISRMALLARIVEIGGPDIGDSTLRRAEAGRSSARHLKWVAQALGFPPNRYAHSPAVTGPTLERQPWIPKFDLSGAWEVFYLEDDVGAPPYLCTERLVITQNGTDVSGIYLPVRSDHPLGYVGTDAFRMTGVTADNVVFGQYHRENVTHLQGAGVFQLLIERGGAWAEGACTFYSDDGSLVVSLNLWLKEDSAQFSIMRAQARTLFEKYKHYYWRLPHTS